MFAGSPAFCTWIAACFGPRATGRHPMSRITRVLFAALFLSAAAGSAAAEPPPLHGATASSEPLWFEVPAAGAPVVRAGKQPRTRKPRLKLRAKKSRYGNISLESLAARERGRPAVVCAAACGERQLVRKPRASRREQRISDLTQAVQLYR